MSNARKAGPPSRQPSISQHSQQTDLIVADDGRASKLFADTEFCSQDHRRNTSPDRSFCDTATAGLPDTDRALFNIFGQGERASLPYECVHHAFEHQAAMRPHAVAAIHGATSISYRQLNDQADRLAALLALHGVRRGDNVALFLTRSIPMLIGIMAILKIGAAYVPQHVSIAPADQLKHILKVAEARVILTLSEYVQEIPTPDGHIVIAIDEITATPSNGAVVKFIGDAAVSGDNTCFVLFTSGTTGKPNGVRISHRNVCNILHTSPGDLGIRPGDRVAQILNIAFDMAAWEIHGCLSHGATLLIRGRDIQETVGMADVVIATPSILGSLDADHCRNVRTVAVAGEPCPKPLADTWSEFCRFYNSCGPTETTIINTAQLYQSDGNGLTIGKPTPNNTVYILDENRHPCRIGEVGEMWAGGACVSQGYLCNDALNAERYAPDPFLGNGARMFRTKDLGRWTPEGELEHFGRVDDQVKIRGFRVELDSVSAVMEADPQCEQAVTLKLDACTLATFVRPASVDPVSARARIAETLPYYCVPTCVIAMETFPKTSRGKVDKQALRRRAESRLNEMQA